MTEELSTLRSTGTAGVSEWDRSWLLLAAKLDAAVRWEVEMVARPPARAPVGPLRLARGDGPGDECRLAASPPTDGVEEGRGPW